MPSKAPTVKTRILVIHGPNLNLLGEREPEIYGSMTLTQLNEKVKKHALDNNCLARFFQSNSEGELIDRIHKERSWADVIVINAGAYTHYSYALRDALSAVSMPVYEVHLSDIHSREPFRKLSVIKDVCRAQISGHGWKSYTLAIDAFLKTKG